MTQNESSPRVRIGCGPFPHDRRRYFELFDCVELSEMYLETPRLQTLRGWRANHGGDFAFVPVATQWLTGDALDLRGTPPEGLDRRDLGLLRDTEANARLLGELRDQVAAIEARYVLAKTPATFFPTETNRAALATFATRIRDLGATLVWEPRGVWTTEETIELCAAIGAMAAIDPYVDERLPDVPSAPIYYVLTGPRGRRDFTPDDMSDLVDFLGEHEAGALVIARGGDRDRTASALRRALEAAR